MAYIFNDADEKYAKAVVLYTDGTDLFVDAEKKTKVTHDEALSACFKGLLIQDTTKEYSAVTAFKDDAGTLTVSVGETDYTVKDPSL